MDDVRALYNGQSLGNLYQSNCMSALELLRTVLMDCFRNTVENCNNYNYAKTRSKEQKIYNLD